MPQGHSSLDETHRQASELSAWSKVLALPEGYAACSCRSASNRCQRISDQNAKKRTQTGRAEHGNGNQGAREQAKRQTPPIDRAAEMKHGTDGRWVTAASPQNQPTSLSPRGNGAKTRGRGTQKAALGHTTDNLHPIWGGECGVWLGEVGGGGGCLLAGHRSSLPASWPWD